MIGLLCLFFALLAAPIQVEEPARSRKRSAPTSVNCFAAQGAGAESGSRTTIAGSLSSCIAGFRRSCTSSRLSVPRRLCTRIGRAFAAAPRIHGELLKLGFEIAQSSVAKYMVKRPGPTSQGGARSCETTRPTSPPWTYSLSRPSVSICSMPSSSSDWIAETSSGSTSQQIRRQNGLHASSPRHFLGITLRATKTVSRKVPKRFQKCLVSAVALPLAPL
jgi:hypothetical protein